MFQKLLKIIFEFVPLQKAVVSESYSDHPSAVAVQTKWSGTSRKWGEALK